MPNERRPEPKQMLTKGTEHRPQSVTFEDGPALPYPLHTEGRQGGPKPGMVDDTEHEDGMIEPVDTSVNVVEEFMRTPGYNKWLEPKGAPPKGKKVMTESRNISEQEARDRLGL